MHPKLSFHHIPFLYIFTFTFLGIVYSYYTTDFEDIILMAMIGILFIAIEINLRSITNKFISTLLFPFLFFTLGTLSSVTYKFANQDYSLHDEFPIELSIVITDINKTKNGHWKGEAKVKSKNGNKITIHEKILFYANKNLELHVGDLIRTKTKLNKFKNKGNPGEFNSTHYWKSKGIRFYTFLNENSLTKIDHNKLNLFQKTIFDLRINAYSLLKKQLEGQDLAIANALLLGDKSSLDNETKSTFTNTGAMHLLAVSGLHIGIILVMLMKFFSYFSKFISRKNAIIIAILLLWIYALITGCSPSIIRSVFMFSCIGIAQMTGKKSNPINVLFFTAFVTILINPNIWMSVGFQLSYLAMFGIYLIYPTIERWFKFQNKIMHYLWQGIAVALSAQLMTFPVVFFHFHQFPNYFLVSNIILIVLSGVLLTSGIIMLLSSKLMFLSSLTAKFFIGILFILILLLEHVADLPGSVAKGFELSIWIVLVLIVVIILLMRSHLFSIRWMVFLLMLSPIVSLVLWNRHNNLSSSHIIFFNENNLTFAVKKDDQVIGFVDNKKSNYMSSTNILENYSKIYPGKLSLVVLDSTNGEVYFGSDRISWSKKQKKIIVSLNEKKFTIHYSNFFENDKSNTNIYMPWIDHKNSLNRGYFEYKLF